MLAVNNTLHASRSIFMQCNFTGFHTRGGIVNIFLKIYINKKIVPQHITAKRLASGIF